jgi:deoxycytidine triphosphate deaminase
MPLQSFGPIKKAQSLRPYSRPTATDNHFYPLSLANKKVFIGQEDGLVNLKLTEYLLVWCFIRDSLYRCFFQVLDMGASIAI